MMAAGHFDRDSLLARDLRTSRIPVSLAVQAQIGRAAPMLQLWCVCAGSRFTMKGMVSAPWEKPINSTWLLPHSCA